VDDRVLAHGGHVGCGSGSLGSGGGKGGMPGLGVGASGKGGSSGGNSGCGGAGGMVGSGAGGPGGIEFRKAINGSERSNRCTNRKAVSWAFCAFLILCSHVLALPDGNASSQHLMPKPSFSVTNPTPAELRLSAWIRFLIIGRIVQP